jgi:hypothetical protein
MRVLPYISASLNAMAITASVAAISARPSTLPFLVLIAIVGLNVPLLVSNLRNFLKET